ncbi:hypothetical protein [Blastococcus montanus]|uniref:hypothetical protein n=1 Tax=Blastococcus montanus TaxID=3144973 RepID=UPI00320ACC88
MPEPPATGAVRNPDLLAVYCNDHLAAATGLIELVGRMLGRHRGSRFEEPLERLLDELREQRAALRTTMGAMGLPVRRYKLAAVWVAEKLGRGALNGRLLTRSPLSDLLEFEIAVTAVLAMRQGFQTLSALGQVDRRVDADLHARLVEQTGRQHRWLSAARREVAATVFGGRPEAAAAAAGS